MSVTDIQLMQQVQYSLLENGNADAAGTFLWLTTMFTSDDIIIALDQAQQRFILDTGMMIAQSQIPAQAGVGRYDITPATSMAVRRVSYQIPAAPGTGYGQGGYGQGPYGGQSLNTTVALTRADTWEQDHGIVNWDTTPGNPISWWETTLPSLTVGIAPAPVQSGFLNLLFVVLAATLTGTGTKLTIPDDFTPYVIWGALGAILFQDGEAYDPVRAKYCNDRYDEGVDLVRMILRG